MALSELAVRKAQPRDKLYLMPDEDGLVLCVWPSGTKIWRLRYWVNGKEKKKSIGEYPLLSLKDARCKRDEVRRAILEGRDPFPKENIQCGGKTFEDYAMAWWNERRNRLTNAKNIQTMEHRLKAYILPTFGGCAPAAITASELAEFIKTFAASGKLETTHRTLDMIRQIFRYAIEAGALEHNPALDIRGILPRRTPVHHPSVTEPEKIAVLRDRIRASNCYPVIKYAMLFSLYTFARPGEIRFCEWKEINWDAREWHIPAEKMKSGVKHIVPLSRQALEILEAMKPISLHWGKYVFTSVRCYDGSKVYSDMAINEAMIKRLGYKPREVSAHGFRSTASTCLNESGLWHWDAIEAQLAHSGSDRVRKAYNYARYMQERREMMQWYADYIDGLKSPECAEQLSFN